MKFEEMYIKASANQKPKIYEVLEKNGFKRNGFLGGGEYVTTYEDGSYSDLSIACTGYPVYSFDEFMEKYGKQNKMIELISKAKSELKMNDSELSLALGKSRQYIGKMLRLPQSKKVQDKVIKEINEFMDKAKNPNEENVVLGNLELIDCNELSALRFQNNQATKEISDLKKANEQQKLVIDKLDDQLLKAEKIHNEDVKTIEAKDKEIKYLNERRIEYKDVSIKKQRMVDSLTKENELLTGKLEHSRRETDYFVNQFKRVEDELKELTSSHTTSKALNWFFVVAIILAAIVWKAYNG